MIQQGFITPWSIFTPTVFRLLERQYVDRFFATGELMLSSFRRFSSHEHEAMRDNEGKHTIVGRGPSTTFFAVTGHGDDAFVLCGTACQPTGELMGAFRADAAIQIFNTTEFAAAVGRHVPGFRQGFEGYCRYADGPVECKINDVDIEHFKNHPEDCTLDLTKVAGFSLNMAGQSVYFQKKPRFRDQLEYRWVWLTEAKTPDNLVVTVPEATQYCLPWYGDGG